MSQRQERANAPRRRGGASGLQVSYRKAIEAVALVYRAEGLPQDAATEIAELALDPALSPTQRARLEQMRSRGRG